ncbi:MAG: tetratricopeptide repeat protein [Pseudomonadota bacterium]
MTTLNRIHNCIVAAVLATVAFYSPVWADDDRLETLYADLLSAEPADAKRIAKEIELAWTFSGSSAADLLLKRGSDALEAGDIGKAIEHLTALTDHAPDFAEGWYMRGIAFTRAEMFGPALADFEQALALEPRHYNAIASLGGLLFQINQYEMAKQAFDLVLDIHPHHEEAGEAIEAAQREVGGAEL